MIRSRDKLRALERAADLAVVAGSFLLAWVVRFETGWIPLFDPRPEFQPYVILLGIMVPVWAGLLQVGSAGRNRARTFGEEIAALLQVHTFGTLLTFALIFFLRIYSYSRIMMVLFWCLSTVALVAERALGRWLLLALGQRGVGLRNVMVLGIGEPARQVLKRLQWSPELGYRLVGVLAPGRERVGTRIRRIPVLGTYEDVEHIAEREEVDLVIVALSTPEQKRLGEILEYLGDAMVDVWVVPDFAHHVRLRGGVAELEGLPLISLQASPMGGWNAVCKRLADLILAGISLVVLSPLMALLSLAVRLSSPGPVLYRQERMGLDGRRFQILKFRTMRQDAESAGARFATDGDPRVTRIGRILRKTSLDELPQLVNVLRGEMSLVGPRPERPVFIEDFRRSFPRYMLRHRVKSGMTGFAQVHGLRGNTSLAKRLDYDLFYIENWSLWLDLKILWMTIPAVFRGRGAV